MIDIKKYTFAVKYQLSFNNNFYKLVNKNHTKVHMIKI